MMTMHQNLLGLFVALCPALPSIPTRRFPLRWITCASRQTKHKIFVLQGVYKFNTVWQSFFGCKRFGLRVYKRRGFSVQPQATTAAGSRQQAGHIQSLSIKRPHGIAPPPLLFPSCRRQPAPRTSPQLHSLSHFDHFLYLTDRDCPRRTKSQRCTIMMSQ